MGGTVDDVFLGKIFVSRHFYYPHKPWKKKDYSEKYDYSYSKGFSPAVLMQKKRQAVFLDNVQSATWFFVHLMRFFEVFYTHICLQLRFVDAFYVPQRDAASCAEVDKPFGKQTAYDDGYATFNIIDNAWYKQLFPPHIVEFALYKYIAVGYGAYGKSCTADA